MRPLTALASLSAAIALGADWPQWQFDAQRSGVSPQKLPAELSLRWTWQLPKRKPAWEHTLWVHRLGLDTAYSPVVFGKTLYVGCSHNGALLALDTETGAERWRFCTSGPIRYAPIATAEAVYVASDDGCLYALDPAKGMERWRVRGGPSDRKVIGHEMLISAWPASAGPVLVEGIIVFVAGLWGTDGVFVHGLDAKTGKILWTDDTLDFRPHGHLIVQGDRVFIPGLDGFAALEWKTGAKVKDKVVPPRPQPPALPDPPGVEGPIALKLAADDKLFAATNDGRVYCFAAKSHAPAKTWPAQPHHAPKAGTSGRGYYLIWGLKDGDMAQGVMLNSSERTICADPDAKKVDGVRRRLDALGLFDAHRLQVLVADPMSGSFPPHFASVITSEHRGRDGLISPAGLAAALRLLQPFRGAVMTHITIHGDVDAVFRAALKEHKHVGTQMSARTGHTFLERAGPLPGAADWTHEFADAGNRLAVRDALIKAPLGILWYGGPAAHHRFYFDGAVNTVFGGDHVGSSLPPQAEFVEGRMILQSRALLSAFDQYTGLPLWEAKLPDSFVFPGLGIHSKKHSEPWRDAEALKAEVPPTHRPRASGYNYVSMPDAIHVAAATRCLRFDPATGEQLASWPVPIPPPKDEPWCWGNLRVEGDLLVATAFKPSDIAAARAGGDGNGGAWVKDRMRMSHILALNRKDGKLLWSREAKAGFLNQGIAVGGNRVFAVDLVPDYVMAEFAKSGRPIPPEPPMLRAFDLSTGKDAWAAPLEMQVMQLTYSPERDILLAPAREPVAWKGNAWVKAPGQARGKPAGLLRAFRGADGKPLYELAEFPYFEPHCVLGDIVIDRYCHPYDLLTGKPHLRMSRLTGLPEAWDFDKSGCNHLVASDGLVPFRPGYYDLAEGAGGARLRQFNGGCTPSHIPAGGLLNAPNLGIKHDPSRTTALAYVHQPENEAWFTFNGLPPKEPTPLKRAGFNFGAPGDRAEPDGSLWLGVPAKGRSLASRVKIAPADASFFRIHSLRAKPGEPGTLPWVAASGVAGAREIVLPIGFNLPAGDKAELRNWTVRLHFAEPDDLKSGQRVFAVSLQGKSVLDRLDIIAAAGERLKPLVREFKGIEARDTLAIALTPAEGSLPPLLCGVELAAE
ncbi:MAG: hypothetical protein FJ291_14500 [Planctomycetes bacterium]|nr:hypothetical protein [Planctomycetota bacterium]